MKLLKINQSRLHTFTEEEMKRILTEELGIAEGATVFIHSSMNQLKIDFPFFKLIRLLQDIVGQEGTLLFPCWQNAEDLKTYAAHSIFDVRRTPTSLGLLPEFVRRQKGAYRSLSPFNSVTAIGKNAREMIKDHHLDELSCGVKSPFYKLTEAGGIIVGIGVSTRYLTFVHCIEDTFPGKFPMQTRETESTIFNVKTAENEVVEVSVKLPHTNIAHRNIPAFLKKNIKPDIACDLKIKGTSFFKADAKRLYQKMQELAKKGITIYSA
ncbi:MAG: AAC(3) family N-acetyltransferase [Bacteroidetes bacterium]|nr:AAC(3) family N-acetyltransferase [Bacteroidota bacterium]